MIKKFTGTDRLDICRKNDCTRLHRGSHRAHQREMVALGRFIAPHREQQNMREETTPHRGSGWRQFTRPSRLLATVAAMGLTTVMSPLLLAATSADVATGIQGQTITGNILTNDTPQSSTGTFSKLVSYAIAGMPGTFLPGDTVTISGVGQIVITASGAYTFTPLASFTGAVPQVTYLAEADEPIILGSIDTKQDLFKLISISGDSALPRVGNLGEYMVQDTQAAHVLDAYGSDYATDATPPWTTETFTFDDNAALGFIRPPLGTGDTEWGKDPDDGVWYSTPTISYSGAEYAGEATITLTTGSFVNYRLDGVTFADDSATFYLNGHLVGSRANLWWQDPTTFSLAIDPAWISPNPNSFVANIHNGGGISGLVLKANFLADEQGSSTLSMTVTMVSPVAAVNDIATAVNGQTGDTAALNVLTGDTVNGVAATSTTAILSVATGSSLPTGLTFNAATGAVGVNAGTPAGTYSFDYQICDANNVTDCKTATATVTVAPSTDLVISKTDGKTSAYPGDTVTYTIVATNNGPDSIDGAIVTDSPGSGLNCPGTNNVTITGPGAPPGSFTISNLSGAGITLGILANGQSATLTYSCTIN